MSTVRRIAPVVAFAAAAVALVATPAAGADRPTPERFDVQTRTVQLSNVTSGTQYAAFTVPDCVTEIAYVIDGAAGGASRKTGTPQRAEGGVGAVRSGTLRVNAGEQLRLYPAQQGYSTLTVSDTGDAGGGGEIGFRAGGGGTGKDDGWLTRQNAGAGGGASSAITLGATPLVVAAGGGGAGGSSWNAATNTGKGGAGDAAGFAGVSHPGSGGLLNIVASGLGGKATEPSGNGGGGGGGGAGYVGGGGGRGTSSGSQGGGGGAGGTSYVDASRVGASSITDFGLSAADLNPVGDGAVKIAWYGCASVLTINGTTTTSMGTTTPAAGWAHSLATTAALRPGSNLALDVDGRADVTLGGYASASVSIPVTVTQTARAGWVMRDWTTTTMNGPLATCIVNGDSASTLPVTNVDAHSFRISVPANSWVSCTFDTVEASPGMDVISDSRHLLTGALDPTSVTSGDEVEFGYTVRNTGNLPLNLTATDPKTPDLACAKTALLPGTETRCAGTASITRD